jgi:hypothetical protein
MKLMPDYGCSPVWEYLDGDLIDNPLPEQLSVTDELKDALVTWAAVYDATLDQSYPPDSGFASATEEAAFEAEGRRLFMGLQAQLSPHYKVVYFSQTDGKLYDH